MVNASVAPLASTSALSPAGAAGDDAAELRKALQKAVDDLYKKALDGYASARNGALEAVNTVTRKLEALVASASDLKTEALVKLQAVVDSLKETVGDILGELKTSTKPTYDALVAAAVEFGKTLDSSMRVAANQLVELVKDLVAQVRGPATAEVKSEESPSALPANAVMV